MLHFIKLLHTIIWCFFAGMIFYLLYSGITGEITAWVWVFIVFVVLEGIIILLNKRRCPLTPWAAKYTDNRKANFDIYLPLWLARYNKVIFSSLFLLGLVLIMVRLIF